MQSRVTVVSDGTWKPLTLKEITPNVWRLATVNRIHVFVEIRSISYTFLIYVFI